ncbi:holo-(acyl-carrier protein) synthase, putative [Plasmodium gallinaceum]|uniref:Holo-(Acyl-carrier protein) synthase, putative n=1 Tax=Plasmodium gallinaceum TaxID=5849 RepID=A0A1J1GQB7_PLAGA|nr:holo-(acyl-carrier protein) synthase, putative [Plasmodium gallinaceum]CRG93234.1 holo-(acyl-carrier protein) synthase, putative [Plasmodium gallinaceum]
MLFLCFKLNNVFLKIIKLLFFYLFLYDQKKFFTSVYTLEIKNIVCKNVQDNPLIKHFFFMQNNNKINEIFTNKRKKRNMKEFYIKNSVIEKKLKKKYILNGNKKVRSKYSKKENDKKILNKIFMIDENYKSIFNKINSSMVDNELNNRIYDQSYERNSFLEISNNQIDIPIDLPHFEKEVRKLIYILNFKEFQLNITFVDSKEMKKINKKHRNKNKPTDVISILHFMRNKPSILNDDLIDTEILDKQYFKSGDIYLCPDYINRECFLSKMKYEKNILNANEVQKGGDNNNEEENIRGVNKLFQNVFSVNERLPFYVLHGLVHLMNKDHENNLEEYNDFMNIEEDAIEKYLNFHHYTQTFYSHHIIGFGTDILSVSRIHNIVLKKNKNNFLNKVLNSLELKELKENSGIDKDIKKLAIYISKKFAAKEAILKSIGRGLSSISKYGLSMNDIEIRNDKYGKPDVHLYNKAKRVANEMGIVKIFLSISDEKIICTDNFNNCNLTSNNSSTYLIHAQALAVGSNI